MKSETEKFLSQMIDNGALFAMHLNSANIWFADANRYSGSRRQWRLDKARAHKRKAELLLANA